MAKHEQLARTVELDASYNGHTMHAYMVPGMCGLRSFHGFDGNYRASPPVAPTPQDIIIGMVLSGISGCTMIFTASHDGAAKRAGDFRAFVENEGLGKVTLTPGVQNQYTGQMIYTIVYEYNIRDVAEWVARKMGKPKWERPEDDWSSITDKLHMDTWFYSYGGRPLADAKVRANTGGRG